MTHTKIKQYIEVPEVPDLSLFGKVAYIVKSMILTLPFIVAARIKNGFGLAIRWRCFIWAAKSYSANNDAKILFDLLFRPLDSTRYFEMEIANTWSAELHPQHCIDVSSPKLFPLMLLSAQEIKSLQVCNPDVGDLQHTRSFLAAFEDDVIEVTYHSLRLKELVKEGLTGDLVTSISVMEHIPDENSFEDLWKLVSPGGYLFVTLPCAKFSWDQYISSYDYGVLEQGDTGYTFWQHYFDQSDVDARILRVCGEPVKSCIWGEKRKGTFFRNTSLKRCTNNYPYWKEPYYMARDYGIFETIEALPGEGVVALLFKKPLD